MADYAFAGCIAVVTGASRGIGRATALALARCGCEVVLVARPSPELEQVALEIAAEGQAAHQCPCDLSDHEAIQSLADDLRNRYERIDILVNCAGVGKFGPFDSISPAEARAPLRVPLEAAVLMSHGLLPLMKDNPKGRIINLTGPAAYFDLPWMAAYTASRTGLLSFTRALDEELRGRGVQVKCVCPCWVDTDYIRRNDTDGDWLPRVARFFPTSSPEQAAGFVLDAIRSRKREIKPSLLLQFCALSYRWFPNVSVGLFKLAGLYRPPALGNIQTNTEGAKNWTNWEESIALNPAKTVFATAIEEVQQIVTDTVNYPSPVRPAGSRHSTTHCGVTDQGTLLIMRKMDRVLSINRAQMLVTVQAGALYIDVARKLQSEQLQFYVNVEIGNLTMGSAASTGTKDASMPGEKGQVCSYCAAVKMVTADGSVVEIDERQPQLLQKVRSSYGLYGVIVETTFRVKAIRPMAVRHQTYTLDQFEDALPALRLQGDSMMYYLYPFQDKLTVEFRRYIDAETDHPNRWLWPLRNLFWKTIAPIWGYLATKYIPFHRIRYTLIDGFYSLIRTILATVLRNERTIASDQIIRYPEHKGISKYTFSIWAFPEQDIMPTMRAYYAFCRDYYQQHGFRCNMLNVGYRIEADQNPIFSYSYDGTVMTLDPVTTGGEGWDEFLRAYNAFCSEHNGVPLFNQSKWLTRDQVHKAFGPRVATFWQTRNEIDPEERFTNQYFRDLLS